MAAPKYRGDCVECGEPVHSRSTSTKTCSVSCGYALRSRALTREPLIATPPPLSIKGPLVPPIGAVHENVNTPGFANAARSRTHLIIPDCQVHSGVPTQHLEWVGKYVAAKRPDVIVCIGDFADMPSLCSFDKGKKSFEGRRYVLDIEAAREAMELLVSQFRNVPGYKPRMVLTLGNHEDRITRAVEDAAILDGVIGLHDLAYESFGWEVHPYLKIVTIDGIEYSHYFAGQGAKGFAVCSARALLNARGGSAIMGHVQHTDVAFHARTQKIAIFAGTCYLHDEDYLGLQGNAQRRQILMLHEVNDGRFDPMFVSLEYLRRRYARAA